MVELFNYNFKIKLNSFSIIGIFRYHGLRERERYIEVIKDQE